MGCRPPVISTLQAPPRITLVCRKKRNSKNFDIWVEQSVMILWSYITKVKLQYPHVTLMLQYMQTKFCSRLKKNLHLGFGLCAPVWFPFKGGEICYQMTDPAAIQWRSSAHISQEFPWLSCHLLHFLLLQLILSSPDERDAIQKKTFTKWVNKHLKKVRYCNIDLCIF